MAGSFLDTTIVIDLAKRRPVDKSLGSLLGSNVPVESPYYAIRELLAGHLRILCDVHNRILASSNIGEMLIGISSLIPAVGRRKHSALQAFAVTLERQCQANPDGKHLEIFKETRRDLALEIARLWRRALQPAIGTLVQPLACFSPGKLLQGESGELRGSLGSFNCAVSERCSAASYLSDNEGALSKMIAALHPDRLPERLNGKAEIASRRKALKELQSLGSKKFNKRNCRALGDAYFAAMCPSGSNVITTNQDDYVPLCECLGKKVVVP